MDYAKRIKAVQKLLTENNLEAFFVSKKENIAYLSGFKGTRPYIFIDRKNAYIFLSPLEKGNLHFKGIEISEIKEFMLSQEGVKTGLEGKDLCIAEKKILKNLKTKLFDNFIENIRLLKDEEEIILMKKSSHLADESMRKAFSYLKEGVSEKEFAWILEKEGREMGAGKTSFGPIVAFGENSAIPHHQSGEKRLEKNMPILVDWGFFHQGYSSDITRSFFFGKATKEWEEAYQKVLTAQKEAEKLVRVGVSCQSVHKKAEEFLGEKLIHGLGHGIGLEVHEKPHINPKSKSIFLENMCFTIEPGLYYKGKFGIRLENTYVLNKDKLQSLNNFNYQLAQGNQKDLNFL